jgi:hypothetical protein
MAECGLAHEQVDMDESLSVKGLVDSVVKLIVEETD